jgi:hypothetical protein
MKNTRALTRTIADAAKVRTPEINKAIADAAVAAADELRQLISLARTGKKIGDLDPLNYMVIPETGDVLEFDGSIFLVSEVLSNRLCRVRCLVACERHEVGKTIDFDWMSREETLVLVDQVELDTGTTPTGRPGPIFASPGDVVRDSGDCIWLFLTVVLRHHHRCFARKIGGPERWGDLRVGAKCEVSRYDGAAEILDKSVDLETMTWPV